MIALTIKNMRKIKRDLDKFNQQVPRAMTTAINTVAFIARKNIRAEMSQVFDRPTPFTLNAVKVEPAKIGKSEARVVFKDPPRLSDSQHYLYPNVYGVKRGFKKYEAMLYAAGILPRGWYTVPTKSANLDQYGNIAKTQIIQILSYFEAFKDKGFKSNSTEKTRAKLKKGTKKKYGTAYFAVKPGNKTHLKPGIYQQTFTGFGSAIKPILIFTKKSGYERKLEFFLIGRQSYDQHFNKIFNREMDKLSAA